MIFKNRRIIPDKLILYGFVSEADSFLYHTDITDGIFDLLVTVSPSGTVSAKVIDKESGDEYVLHKMENAIGSFVGNVRAEYEAVLSDIVEKCTESDVFKSKTAHDVIKYVFAKYGDELEFLWTKSPHNAVLRRKDTGKWYAALLTVSASKLGLYSDEKLEIIDLRIQPEKLPKLIDNEKFFPGYHMNKKSWYTIKLDGSVISEEIFRRIDESYLLAVK